MKKLRSNWICDVLFYSRTRHFCFGADFGLRRRRVPVAALRAAWAASPVQATPGSKGYWAPRTAEFSCLNFAPSDR
jgi:hypothetical protein